MNSASVTMAADSTQKGEPKKYETPSEKRANKRKRILQERRAKKLKRSEGRKRKNRSRSRSRSRGDSDSDCESDLDLRKELKPVGHYVHHREEMLEHMFRSISNKKLKAMMPECVKELSIADLKMLCLEQLDMMSRKRILSILDGADPDVISSTDTEDDSTEEEELEVEHASADGSIAGSVAESPGIQAAEASQSQHIDSTSLQEDKYSECSESDPGSPQSAPSIAAASGNDNREEDRMEEEEGEEEEMVVEEEHEGEEEEKQEEVEGEVEEEPEAQEEEMEESTQTKTEEVADDQEEGEVEEEEEVAGEQEEETTSHNNDEEEKDEMEELQLDVPRAEMEGLLGSGNQSPEEGEVFDDEPPPAVPKHKRSRSHKSSGSRHRPSSKSSRSKKSSRTHSSTKPAPQKDTQSVGKGIEPRKEKETKSVTVTKKSEKVLPKPKVEASEISDTDKASKAKSEVSPEVSKNPMENKSDEELKGKQADTNVSKVSLENKIVLNPGKKVSVKGKLKTTPVGQVETPIPGPSGKKVATSKAAKKPIKVMQVKGDQVSKVAENKSDQVIKVAETKQPQRVTEAKPEEIDSEAQIEAEVRAILASAAKVSDKASSAEVPKVAPSVEVPKKSSSTEVEKEMVSLSEMVASKAPKKTAVSTPGNVTPMSCEKSLPQAPKITSSTLTTLKTISEKADPKSVPQPTGGAAVIAKDGTKKRLVKIKRPPPVTAPQAQAQDVSQQPSTRIVEASPRVVEPPNNVKVGANPGDNQPTRVVIKRDASVGDSQQPSEPQRRVQLKTTQSTVVSPVPGPSRSVVQPAAAGQRKVLKRPHSLSSSGDLVTQMKPSPVAGSSKLQTAAKTKAVVKSQGSGSARTVIQRSASAPTQAPDTEQAGGDDLSPNQMEILELEMRARAIKAMLNSQGSKKAK